MTGGQFGKQQNFLYFLMKFSCNWIFMKFFRFSPFFTQQACCTILGSYCYAYLSYVDLFSFPFFTFDMFVSLFAFHCVSYCSVKHVHEIAQRKK
jgi:hypothetical protein